jgi:hypothetical protein
MNKFDVWRIVRLTVIFSLVAWFAMQWMQMILNPVSPTGADFIHFYSAGRVAQRFGFSSVYNLDLQQKIEEEVVGFDMPKGQTLPYNHIPYLIPLLRVLMDSSYVGSFTRWVIILLVLFITGNFIFLRAVFPDQSFFNNMTLLGGAVIFYPFFISLLMGQDSTILYFGVVLLSIGILKKNDWLAGLGLALVTVRPHIFLALAIPIFIRFVKVWWRFFTPTLILVVFSIVILGEGGIKEFVNILLITAGGNWFGTNQSVMFNLLGLTLRILPFIDEQALRVVSWVGYILGIGLLSIMWLHAEEFDENLLGLSILGALFFAPHLHYHDLTLLILPMLLAIRTNIPSYSFSRVSTLFIGISATFFISAAALPVYFSLPYLLCVALAWMFLHQRFDIDQQKSFV